MERSRDEREEEELCTCLLHVKRADVSTRQNTANRKHDAVKWTERNLGRSETLNVFTNQTDPSLLLVCCRCFQETNKKTFLFIFLLIFMFFFPFSILNIFSDIKAILHMFTKLFHPVAATGDQNQAQRTKRRHTHTQIHTLKKGGDNVATPLACRPTWRPRLRSTSLAGSKLRA